MDIHDLAREFLATDGLKMSDTQKKAVFEFADWLLVKDAGERMKRHDIETRERIAELENQLFNKAPGCTCSDYQLENFGCKCGAKEKHEQLRAR